MTSRPRTTLIALFVLLAGGAPDVLAQALAHDAARGAALLADARKALGGDDRLRAVKTLRAAGDFKRSIGQNTIEGEIEILLELPGRLRRNEDLSLPGGGPAVVRTEVLNGTEVWDENTGNANFVFRRGGGGGGDAAAGRRGGGRGPVDSEQLRQFQLQARQVELARWLLALLLNTGDDAVAWIATAESPDGNADVLEILPPGGVATSLFLDATTHMPRMLRWVGGGPQLFIGRRGGPPQGAGDQPAGVPRAQQSTTLRMTLEDYKAVNGIKLPHFITRGANDQTMEEWTVSNYRINPSFRADTFTKK